MKQILILIFTSLFIGAMNFDNPHQTLKHYIEYNDAEELETFNKTLRKRTASKQRKILSSINFTELKSTLERNVRNSNFIEKSSIGLVTATIFSNFGLLHFNIPIPEIVQGCSMLALGISLGMSILSIPIKEDQIKNSIAVSLTTACCRKNQFLCSNDSGYCSGPLR